MFEISINLATHNRAAFLEPCLVSLCEQTLDPSRYEICVVNNACTDNTAEVVEKIAALYPKHRVFMVREPLPGLSRARNAGLRATQAPLVANVDDDGTVYPDWLESYIARFAAQGSDTAVIGGEIEPVWEKPKPEWLTLPMELYLSSAAALGTEARFLIEGESARECNACYRRSALMQAGGFPEELGRIGSCLLSGEHAVEFLIRKNGGRIFFDPKIIMRHFIHADRLNPMWLRRRAFWQGVSAVATRHYQIKHKLPVTEEAFINLPLKTEDWSFLKQDTQDRLEESMFLFYSLGFVLALTDIMPVEGSGTPQIESETMRLRRQAFQKGVASCADSSGAEDDLPLDRNDWLFINNGNEPASEDQLNRLHTLGLTLAQSGFIQPEPLAS
jgi:hypothetical protein